MTPLPELDIRDTIVDLGKGVPGAMSVLLGIYEKVGQETFTKLATEFKRVNLTGSAIWIGYKDHCGEDLSNFLETFNSTPAPLFETINKELGGNPVVGEEFVDRRGAIAHAKKQ